MQNQPRWNREYALRILGLPLYADMEMVKKAYRQLCKKYHPDENASTYGLDAYLLVQSAYEYLLANPVPDSTYSYPYGNSFQYQGGPRKSKIIGTGTNPEREKQFETIRRSKMEREELEKKRREQEKRSKEEQVHFGRKKTVLEQEKQKREIEAQFFRVMEALKMLQGDEPQEEKPDNTVYAKRKAYEAFQKYEERNYEGTE